MGTQLVYTCDRCKKTGLSNVSVLRNVAAEPVHEKRPNEFGGKLLMALDLCAECHEALLVWLGCSRKEPAKKNI